MGSLLVSLQSVQPRRHKVTLIARVSQALVFGPRMALQLVLSRGNKVALVTWEYEPIVPRLFVAFQHFRAGGSKLAL